MEREAKKEKSIGIGTTTFVLSCFGISIYDQASHDSYTNYQDKLPFETIFCDKCCYRNNIGNYYMVGLNPL